MNCQIIVNNQVRTIKISKKIKKTFKNITFVIFTLNNKHEHL